MRVGEFVAATHARWSKVVSFPDATRSREISKKCTPNLFANGMCRFEIPGSDSYALGSDAVGGRVSDRSRSSGGCTHILKVEVLEVTHGKWYKIVNFQSHSESSLVSG